MKGPDVGLLHKGCWKQDQLCIQTACPRFQSTSFAPHTGSERLFGQVLCPFYRWETEAEKKADDLCEILWPVKKKRGFDANPGALPAVPMKDDGGGKDRMQVWVNSARGSNWERAAPSCLAWAAPLVTRALEGRTLYWECEGSGPWTRLEVERHLPHSSGSPWIKHPRPYGTRYPRGLFQWRIKRSKKALTNDMVNWCKLDY